MGIEAGDSVTIAGTEMTWGEEFEVSERAERRTAKERRYGSDFDDDSGDNALDDESETYEIFDLDDDEFEPGEGDDVDDADPGDEVE